MVDPAAIDKALDERIDKRIQAAVGALTSDMRSLPLAVASAVKQVLEAPAEAPKRPWLEEVEAPGPKALSADTWTGPSGRKWYCRYIWSSETPDIRVHINDDEVCVLLRSTPPAPSKEDALLARIDERVAKNEAFCREHNFADLRDPDTELLREAAERIRKASA
jgi:hypothetical protein